jgi:hypothetical protein
MTIFCECKEQKELILFCKNLLAIVQDIGNLSYCIEEQLAYMQASAQADFIGCKSPSGTIPDTPHESTTTSPKSSPNSQLQ